MDKINVISTTCKECLFAEYEDDTQVGCRLGKIEKIKNHPVYELIEAMDHEKNFYILNYHLCLHQRVEGWEHDSKSMEEMIRHVQEEIRMNWGAILVLKDEDEKDMSRVQSRLEEILEQTHKPNWIGIVSNDPDRDVYWIIDYLKNTDIPWVVESGEENVRHYIDTIFSKFKNIKFLFYTIFESDKEIPSDYYDKMHSNTIDKLQQYSVIKDEDVMHCMTVNKVAHAKYNGNFEGDLEKKIARKSSISLLLNSKDLS